MDFIEFCPVKPQRGFIASFFLCFYTLSHCAAKDGSLSKRENVDSELVL